MQTTTETIENNLDGAQPVAQSANPDIGRVLLLNAKANIIHVE